MRLSKLASERGIDAFKFDDFLVVGQSLHQDPQRLILVGGQALETWGHVFKVLAPTGDHEPLTEDTDFLGSRKDAQWLSKLLGRETTELHLARDFDPSPNTAILYLQRPGDRLLMIDFLSAIIGVSTEDIERTAVQISVAGVKLNVLHPVLCLKSRLANLQALASKRNTNGVMQAEWAIAVVSAWLERRIEEKADQRELIKSCHLVAELAEFGAGPFCYLHYGLDPLLAVTDEILQSIGGRFVTEDWRRRTGRIRGKREAKQTILKATQDAKYSVRITPDSKNYIPRPGLVEELRAQLSSVREVPQSQEAARAEYAAKDVSRPG